MERSGLAVELVEPGSLERRRGDREPRVPPVTTRRTGRGTRLTQVTLASAAALTALVLTGCGAGGASAPASTSVSTIVKTINPSTPAPVATGPLNTAAVTAATAASCPLLTIDSAADTVGMRLARIEVLSQGQTPAGCRFYALQGSALSASEHLPGPDQPALEINVARYANPTTARNAAVAVALAGTHQEVVSLTGGVQGDVFQTAFDPTDGANDWVLVYNNGATLVTVKTAVSDTSQDAVGVGNLIMPLINVN